eukprot:2070151-Pleurochrysis_carterae.AAC.6
MRVVILSIECPPTFAVTGAALRGNGRHFWLETFHLSQRLISDRVDAAQENAGAAQNLSAGGWNG